MCSQVLWGGCWGCTLGAATMLAPIAGKKALIYYSNGMPRSGTDNPGQLQGTINAAINGRLAAGVGLVDFCRPASAAGVDDASDPAPDASRLFRKLRLRWM